MWFSNLRIFHLTAPLNLTPEDIHERLQQYAFRPCASLEPSAIGWAPPLGRKSKQLTHAAAGAILVCVRKEERILPSAVINEAVAEKVSEIEESEGRPIRRKEKQSLKEEITRSLLPKSHTQSRYTFAFVVPKERLLIVDASSATRAEEVITLMRCSLGSLPVVPLHVKSSPAVIMTSWAQGHPTPAGLVLGDECELKEPGKDGGSARIKRIDLTSDEISTHLEAGKRVVKVALRFEDRIRCVLDEELTVKRLTFEDVIMESLNDMDAHDEAAAFDARFALMILELGRFIPRMIDWFGGIESKS